MKLPDSWAFLDSKSIRVDGIFPLTLPCWWRTSSITDAIEKSNAFAIKSKPKILRENSPAKIRVLADQINQLQNRMKAIPSSSTSIVYWLADLLFLYESELAAIGVTHLSLFFIGCLSSLPLTVAFIFLYTLNRTTPTFPEPVGSESQNNRCNFF